MFRQIRVDLRDCDYQRILKYSQEGELQAWRLTMVTYGTACALEVCKKIRFDFNSILASVECQLFDIRSALLRMSDF